MSLQADIKWIKAELSQVTDPELISAFKSLLTYRKKQNLGDWWDDLTLSEKQEIEAGLKEAEKGKVKSHQEVMKKYEGRY